MHIERISDNQIRCTLSKHDLLERHIKISELAYGSERAKELFRDMMEQANIDFGFDVEDIPLMIEAIPTSRDSLVLVITKVDDPQEFDERFGSFGLVDEDFDDDVIDVDYGVTGDDQPEMSISDELATCFEQLHDMIESYTEGLGDGTTEDSKFIPLAEALRQKSGKKTSKQKNIDNIHERIKVFSFISIKPIIEAAHRVNTAYTGKNTIWKDPRSKKYYLLLNKGSGKHAFRAVCTTLSEYGVEEPITYATQDFFNEHYKVIIKDKALSELSKL